MDIIYRCQKLVPMNLLEKIEDCHSSIKRFQIIPEPCLELDMNVLKEKLKRGFCEFWESFQQSEEKEV